MKKKVKKIKHKPITDDTIANEPLALYRSVKIIPEARDFPFRKFEKIGMQVPFTQKEWAGMLHLSEKTLQRYAKDNKSFEGMYADRLRQLQEIIEMGLEAFTTAEAFYRWLKRDKPVLGNLLSFESLKTSEGIVLLKDEISRIMHGVYI